MHVIAFFNTIGGSNIGLENFVRQGDDVRKTVVVFRQSLRGAESEIARNYPNARLKVIALRSANFIQAFYSLACMVRRTPCVLHAHHASAAVVAVLLKYICRSRLVITVHALFDSYKFRHKVAFGLACIASDLVVCNSEATRTSLPKFINENKQVVIYNGVDFNMLDFAMKRWGQSIGDDSVVVGTVCRMVYQKDLPTLIRAFAKAQRSTQKKLLLRIIGDGEEREKIESSVKAYGLGAYVEFTGMVSRDDVYLKLGEIDIFVVSSRWEGFCNAMVEAAAAGKPVIATRIDSLSEVIGTANARFFSAGDADQLCDELLALIADPGLREALGKKSQAFVRGRYSLDASAACYGSYYRNLNAELGCD